MAKMPQNAAGIRTEPPPSEPRAKGTMPEATAAADPPLDPPLVSSVSQGFRVGPNSSDTLDPDQPSSVVVVFPIIIAPAASMRSTMGALS